MKRASLSNWHMTASVILDEDMTRKMANELGGTLSRGSLKPCDGCTAGKAKQKNVPKESDHVVATEPNEAIVFLDITMIKKPEG
jgi:hypothetical protein